jgi:5-(carboxyamino)imidazole ribonucleotide mutase
LGSASAGGTFRSGRGVLRETSVEAIGGRSEPRPEPLEGRQRELARQCGYGYGPSARLRPKGEQMVQSPRVGLIMGSQSDWSTLRHAAVTLDELAIAHEDRIVSAHRTPERLVEYATTAKARGLQVIIAGAGGAAHLPGMVAAMTTVPVLGVPVEGQALRGLDSLMSIVQMPAGVPVGTLAIGRAGAINAALLAAAILALQDVAIARALDSWRANSTAAVAEAPTAQPEDGEA